MLPRVGISTKDTPYPRQSQLSYNGKKRDKLLGELQCWPFLRLEECSLVETFFQEISNTKKMTAFGKRRNAVSVQVSKLLNRILTLSKHLPIIISQRTTPGKNQDRQGQNKANVWQRDHSINVTVAAIAGIQKDILFPSNVRTVAIQM